MSGFLSVLVMSALLGAASFGIGMLPLSFAFSKSATTKLSAVGTGLLLGAALGVIIPEGVETLVSSIPPSNSQYDTFPTSTIAFCLLAGFTAMLLIEQSLSPHAHAHAHSPTNHTTPSPSVPTIAVQAATPTSTPHTSRHVDGEVQFDADLELGDLERTEGIWVNVTANERGAASRAMSVDTLGNAKARAYPLTLGLVLHALADGLALGSAALSGGQEGEAGQRASELSIIVFLALVIHKAPTALALTTSLLATALPRADCKKHIAAFSASTPLGALLSYFLLSFLGASSNRWPGMALLVSGGTFLYVATSLSANNTPVIEDDGVSGRTRTALVVLGMGVPFCVSALIGHGH